MLVNNTSLCKTHDFLRLDPSSSYISPVIAHPSFKFSKSKVDPSSILPFPSLLALAQWVLLQWVVPSSAPFSLLFHNHCRGLLYTHSVFLLLPFYVCVYNSGLAHHIFLLLITKMFIIGILPPAFLFLTDTL